MERPVAALAVPVPAAGWDTGVGIGVGLGVGVGVGSLVGGEGEEEGEGQESQQVLAQARDDNGAVRQRTTSTTTTPTPATAPAILITATVYPTTTNHRSPLSLSPSPSQFLSPTQPTSARPRTDDQRDHDYEKHDTQQTSPIAARSPITTTEEERERREVEEHEASRGTTATTATPPAQYSGALTGHRKPLVPQQHTALIQTLLEPENRASSSRQESVDYSTYALPPLGDSMANRKIWVKRPGASATLVTILEDNLVDDVRDMILKKYANTLGRSFDSPDVTLRIVPRENRQERALGPEEPICQVLDAYFPGGQTVDEALVIDVPLRRTPRPSPQPSTRYYQEEERRPAEAASDYFPPMPVPTVPSPHIPGMIFTSVPKRSASSPPADSFTFHVGPHYRACA